MKIIILYLMLVLSVISINAQVGIGTVTPNASAKLDITASDKGLLIPRVSLSNVTTTTLDGTNVAAIGLMIYNINTSVIGGDGTGFYTFNGVKWEKLTINSKNISTVPFFGTNYTMNNTTGQDLSNFNTAIEPSIYNDQGKIEVKLVIRYSNTQGTVNMQLRSHNNITENYPITNADSWIFASTQNGGVLTSEWKSWNAGIAAQEIHLFGWVQNSGDFLVIENAYLLVRSQ